MTKLLILWAMPYIAIVVVQYGIGEKYLMIRLKKKKSGYLVVAAGLLVSIVYGVYVMQFVEFMEALGIAQLIVSSVLFYRFSSRYSKVDRM